MILGITGIFGSGKSTVANIFKKYGFYVIDVDKLYRTLIKPNSSLYKKIITEFGKEIIKKNKDIDRNKLKKIVFNDSEKLKKLNKITHPYIIEKIKEEIKRSKNKNIAIDAPLLIEAKATFLVGKIVVVTAKKEKIMQRLIKKGRYTKEEIAKITKSQMPLRSKLKHADYIIDNSGAINETEIQVKNQFFRKN